MTHSHYLVIDLEATCDDQGAVPKHEMETIEIGAVLCDSRTLQPTEEFQSFVRPVRHPTLTPFCTDLTSISQGMIADAPRFPEAMDALGRFIDRRRVLFCSWGNYDRNQLRQDAVFHGIRLPLTHRHLNLKQAFSDRRHKKKRYGMARALAMAGIELTGTHHRGIDDARNIAKLLPHCVEARRR
ncbi:MAG: 3'-5' exonuclease [Myxococcota bacterium]